ncbi:uncharacterized protein LOC115997717 [Ipomoea triloba]|uniref:uncharacterized protein LOC115997717 n=1 Tax=Ipomoea triloba TaxID=35885 RepID=UPI00125E7A72|nr:uncharacterized protein LOC115997717 [Ipomoea triloba]
MVQQGKKIVRSVNQFAALQEEGAQLQDENESSLLVGEITLNREKVQNESMVGHNSQTIHTVVPGLNGKSTCVSFAYVRPNQRAKDVFGEDRRAYSSSFKDPWIMLGDFNDITGYSDQLWGTAKIASSTVDRFMESMNDYGLIDLSTSEPSFSWSLKLGDRVIIRRKLDRVLWNMEAQLLFSE